MSYSFSTELRVRLPETDSIGVVFHGNFYIYFDVARMDYLRGLGLLEGFIAGKTLNLVVHTSADFRSPARFDDVLVVQARVRKIGGSSVTFEFRVSHKAEGRLVAEGKSVHTFVEAGTHTPVRVPEEFRKAVRAFEGSALEETP